MKPEDVVYIRYRLVLARETLEDAQLIFGRGHLHSVVNRLYYACFYVAEAMLGTESMYSTKHRGVLSLFDMHWTKTGRMPAEMSAFYHEIFRQRQEGDYAALKSFDPGKVESWLHNAESFVDLGTEIVEKALSGQ